MCGGGGSLLRGPSGLWAYDVGLYFLIPLVGIFSNFFLLSLNSMKDFEEVKKAGTSSRVQSYWGM